MVTFRILKSGLLNRSSIMIIMIFSYSVNQHYLFYSVNIFSCIIIFHSMTQITPRCYTGWYLTIYCAMTNLLAHVIPNVFNINFIFSLLIWYLIRSKILEKIKNTLPVWNVQLPNIKWTHYVIFGMSCLIVYYVSTYHNPIYILLKH